MYKQTHEPTSDTTFSSPTSPSVLFPFPVSLSPALSDLSQTRSKQVPGNLLLICSRLNTVLTSSLTDTEHQTFHKHRDLNFPLSQNKRTETLTKLSIFDTDGLVRDMCYSFHGNPLRCHMYLYLASFRRCRRPYRTGKPPRLLIRPLQVLTGQDCRA